MSSSDLFAFSFTLVFTLGQEINCFQHSQFTGFLRDEDGPHVSVHRGLVGAYGTTLTRSVYNTNGIQMFC